jgi:hypothetical protein
MVYFSHPEDSSAWQMEGSVLRRFILFFFNIVAYKNKRSAWSQATTMYLYIKLEFISIGIGLTPYIGQFSIYIHEDFYLKSPWFGGFLYCSNF